MIVCLFYSQSIFAQNNDSLRQIYNNGIVYYYGGYYMMGSERMKFNELEKIFTYSELGLADYKLAKKNKTKGKIFTLLSFASGIAGLSFYNSNRNLSYVFFGGQITLLFGSQSCFRSYGNHLNKAIWQRNKDYLFPGN